MWVLQVPETATHLCKDCLFTSSVFSMVLSWQGVHLSPSLAATFPSIEAWWECLWIKQPWQPAGGWNEAVTVDPVPPRALLIVPPPAPPELPLQPADHHKPCFPTSRPRRAHHAAVAAKHQAVAHPWSTAHPQGRPAYPSTTTPSFPLPTH